MKLEEFALLSDEDYVRTAVAGEVYMVGDFKQDHAAELNTILLDTISPLEKISKEIAFLITNIERLRALANGHPQNTSSTDRDVISRALLFAYHRLNEEYFTDKQD